MESSSALFFYSFWVVQVPIFVNFIMLIVVICKPDIYIATVGTEKSLARNATTILF